MHASFGRMATNTLFRPVGQKELELIRSSGMRAFPPRLAWQPIFYPVLNEAYAVEIARDWNTRDAASGHAGFVTRFEVLAEFLSRYEVRTVGASRHQEYWIPAEELPELNRSIVGLIEVVAEFRGRASSVAPDSRSSSPASRARNRLARARCAWRR